MFNLTKASKNLNKVANYNVDGLIFNVTIIALKVSYGILRYQITPLSGSGQKWVNSDSITI